MDFVGTFCTYLITTTQRKNHFKTRQLKSASYHLMPLQMMCVMDSPALPVQ